MSTKGLTESLRNNHSISNGGKYFNENGSQNYLIFQPLFRHFTSKNGEISSWQLKGMSE